MPPPLKSPIALRSCRCLELFLELASNIEVFLELASMEADDPSKHMISAAACWEEFGRFRLWGNSIGAFLTIDRRNSLDFRLREASKISSRIVEFLQDLAEALNDASLIATSRRDNRIAAASKRSSGVGFETTEICELFGTVKDSIRILMQTSTIIRDATPQDRYVKAQSSANNPFLESFDIAHVSHKFPKVDSDGREWLKRRLGKAMAQRRQYLKYCRDHHDKSSRSPEQDQPKVDVSSEGQLLQSDLAHPPDANLMVRSHHDASTVSSVPTSDIAPTEAYTLQPSTVGSSEATAVFDAEDALDNYSQTSYATSVHDNTSENKLYPPSLKDITTTFPFEECDLRLFVDRHTWFTHELESHRLEWCCRFCSHPPFRSETQLSTHMHHRHAQFSSPVQLPALIKASRQSVDRIPATECPLCHWDVTLRELPTHTPSDKSLVVTLERFRRHLGAHMEQLALFAIPRSYRNDEESADSDEAAAMAQSDSRSRELSIGDISWKTESSRGLRLDKEIPDLGPGIIPKLGGDCGPWSQHLLHFPSDIDKSAFNKCSLPRYGAAMSPACSGSEHIILQGGLINGVNDKNDLWYISILKQEEGVCHSEATIIPGSGARVGHAALLIDDCFIIFGGDMKSTTGKDPLDDALYIKKTGHWSKIVAKTKPSGRYGHTMSPLGSSALVFGGQNGEVYFNDLSAFDVNQPYDRPDGTAWETLLPNEPHPDRPLARANHTMVSWDDKLYLFGGTDGELWFSDLWQYSSSNGWTQLRGSSYFPEGRESHAAAVVDGVMFIFGGCNKEGRDLGDLHGYDFAKRRWSYFGTYHDFPSARSGHQMAVHKEKIIMVGGEPYDREDLAVMYTLSPASCFLRAELFGWSGPPWQNGQGQESKW